MTKFFFFSLLLIAFSCKENESRINKKPKQKSNISISNKLLFNIEGLYLIENDSSEIEKCKLEVLITKKNENYFYKLISEERNVTGEISLKLNEQNDGYYITLEGIKWSENEGNIDDESEKNSLDLPIGIQGSLYENEISIQNYGNSMNYYVQLYDCGKKYIHLIKK